MVAALVAALVAAPVSALVGPADAGKPVTLPPGGTDWDYQLGGTRPVPAHVGVVERDRHASPVSGKYNICYVNGFQTQAEQKRFWHRRHWSLVLKDAGTPVVDSVWGEWLLDTRTSAKRHALARIMGRWTDRCAADGFDAVEFDNLDSFSRSHHLLSRKDNKRYAALLVERAHAAGLAAAQKNWAEWDGTAVGYDFVVAEQCEQYRECVSYLEHYDLHVLDVEYRAKPFRRACAQWNTKMAVVRRDVDLTRDGVRRWC
jgi:Glycoside-hydrolase family GH114